MNMLYVFVLIIALVSIFIMSQYKDVDAYSYYRCPDIALTTYKPLDLPSDYLRALRLAVANWNNVPSGLYITETTSDNARIIVKTIYDSTMDENGQAWAVCDSQGRRIPPAIIELNRHKMDNHDILHKQNTIAHELGHATVGLDHSGYGTNANATLMYKLYSIQDICPNTR